MMSFMSKCLRQRAIRPEYGSTSIVGAETINRIFDKGMITESGSVSIIVVRGC